MIIFIYSWTCLNIILTKQNLKFKVNITIKKVKTKKATETANITFISQKSDYIKILNFEKFVEVQIII